MGEGATRSKEEERNWSCMSTHTVLSAALAGRRNTILWDGRSFNDNLCWEMVSEDKGVTFKPVT